MATCHLCNKRHEKQVVVVGEVCLFKYWSKLKLVRSLLIMSVLFWDTKVMAFEFQIEHESLNTLWDGSKIVVLELLILGTFVSHECTACKNQVRTG